ncbi:XRE family transcriptional regulator, partial [Thalassospira sp. MCCC 1A01428]|uniref:XRE family transcriptional regulator n=1 Tax=Thalassospira sp. MCCC 1A01428 TaxID=1470575 RepID=UPI00143D3256
MQNNVRDIRRRRGLTQEQVAELTGGTKGQISKLENGTLQLGANWLERLARALKVEAYELISDVRPTARIPIVGWVSAGAFADAQQVDRKRLAEFPHIDCPDVDEKKCIALNVQGDSMNLVAPEDSVIVVDISHKEMSDGKFYIVATNGG